MESGCSIKVIVTGASGFIGKALVKRLVTQPDLGVRAIVRGEWDATTTVIPSLEFVRGDMRDPVTMRALFEQGCVVVNLAYSSSGPENLLAAGNLAQACIDAQVHRLVHCSTATVVGAARVDEITEETACDPRTKYEVNKLEIEGLLAKAAQGRYELAILRPTAVFGSGGVNLVKLATDLHRRTRLFNYSKSCLFGFRRMNLVCVENVVAALEFLIRTKRRVEGDIFLISDDESPQNNYHNVEKYLMKRFGLRYYRLPLVPIPSILLSTVLQAAGRSNNNPRRVHRCYRLLKMGFAKEISFERGLELFASWYEREFGQDERAH